MSSSLTYLDLLCREKQGNAVKYPIDRGPMEPDLSQYVDADMLKAHCEACQLKKEKNKQSKVRKCRPPVGG